MRALLLLAALLISPATTLALTDPPKMPDGNRACLACHKDFLFQPAEFEKSVHADLSCSDCHDGYDFSAHRNRPTELDDAQKALVKALGQKSKAPEALLACEMCHQGVMEELQGSIHGKWMSEERKARGPLCADCHGSIHAIQKAKGRGSPEARARSERCQKCHGDLAFVRTAGLKETVVQTYKDSIHGRLVSMGSERAPSCASCHGAHHVVDVRDPASPVAGANKPKTCGKCHEGADENFAAVISHDPITGGGPGGHGHPGPHLTHVVFSWLTSLTLLFFLAHVLIDFSWEVRSRIARRKNPHAYVEHHADRGTVVRFDIHQRIQHWLMLSGVILLAVTGWPLRGAGHAPAVESLRGFVALLGGQRSAALLHRTGAVLIILSAVYHLGYLTLLGIRKRLPFSMLPGPRDVVDFKDNMLFLLGIRKQRPRFDRYSYLEKFDYWAVFWGIVMMVGTGFVIWFPVQAAKLAPAWVIQSTQIIHGEEATLAALFLFMVHFYNVHLKPSIFPMNWAWLTGRISVHTLREEHPLEYERTVGTEPTAPARKEP